MTAQVTEKSPTPSVASASPVLVTGVAGFIGSHVSEALLRAGHRVVGIDDFDDYYDPVIKRSNLRASERDPRFELIQGDVRDDASLARAFERGPFSAIIHLAARAGVRPSLADPLLYESVNVLGTTALLGWASRTPSVHFIFGSSSSVYGSTTPAPFSEEAVADRPLSPYAATKRSGELMVHAFHHIHGMPATCLRFFTVYGPRQRPEMAIHRFTRLIDDGAPIPFFGDGTSRRDYTFVDDIVAGVIRAMNTPEGYRVFNLGTADTTTLADLVELIASQLGRPVRIEHLPDQQGDVPTTLADISRARADLGYAPTIPIQVGIGRFIEWYQGSGGRRLST